MEKGVIVALLIGAHATVFAQTLVFTGDSGAVTTGELIDGVKNIAVTTNVQEIAGLSITARSGSDRHKLNTTDTANSFGIDDMDATAATEDTTRFDPGESMVVSFDRTVEITKIDFVGFESNSVFVIAIDGQADWHIGYNDLDNKTAQTIATNLVVAAETEIVFHVGNTNSVIGLQAMDVTLLGGSGLPSLTFASSNETAYVFATFDGSAITNHVLQSCTNLASNVWTTVSAPFAADTNWSIGTTNHAVFFRTIANPGEE